MDGINISDLFALPHAQSILVIKMRGGKSSNSPALL